MGEDRISGLKLRMKILRSRLGLEKLKSKRRKVAWHSCLPASMGTPAHKSRPLPSITSPGFKIYEDFREPKFGEPLAPMGSPAPPPLPPRRAPSALPPPRPRSVRRRPLPLLPTGEQGSLRRAHAVLRREAMVRAGSSLVPRYV